MTDTHRQTDASDLIICPMLCYSNGTDKNVVTCFLLGHSCSNQHHCFVITLTVRLLSRGDLFSDSDKRQRLL